jgi:hypothetical protein
VLVRGSTPAVRFSRGVVVGQDARQAEGSQGVRLEPGEAGDLVVAHGDDEQPAAVPEPVGVVAGIDGQGGLPVRTRLDEAGLRNEPERHLGQELGGALPASQTAGSGGMAIRTSSASRLTTVSTSFAVKAAARRRANVASMGRKPPGLDDPLAGDEPDLPTDDVAVEGGELLARDRPTAPLIPNKADNASASASTAYTCAGSASIIACCWMLITGPFWSDRLARTTSAR